MKLEMDEASREIEAQIRASAQPVSVG